MRVQLDLPDGFVRIAEVPIPKLPYGNPETSYVIIQWPIDLEAASAGTISASLKFLVKDCDPDTGLPDSDEGYDDEYVVRLNSLKQDGCIYIRKLNYIYTFLSWKISTST